jgi:hypothetical protein
MELMEPNRLGLPRFCQLTPSELAQTACGASCVSESLKPMAINPIGATATMTSSLSIEVTAVHVWPSGDVQSPAESPSLPKIDSVAT